MDKDEQSKIGSDHRPQRPRGTLALGPTLQWIIAVLGTVGFVAGVVRALVNSNAAVTVTLLVLSALFLLVDFTGVVPYRVKRLFEPIKASGSWKYGPYIEWEAYAYWAKTKLQMLISLIAVGVLFFRLAEHLLSSSESGTEEIFAIISYALAVAAVLELAYTFFTPGPDEALDPLVLGLSALLLLQFERIKTLDYKQGIAILLYVLALGTLFGVRTWWSNDDELKELRKTRAESQESPQAQD
jgi:hypothetical protein